MHWEVRNFSATGRHWPLAMALFLKPCRHLELLQDPQIQLPSPMPLDSSLLSDLNLHFTSVPQVITSPQTLSSSTISLPPVSLILKSFSDRDPPAFSLSVQLSPAAPPPNNAMLFPPHLGPLGH